MALEKSRAFLFVNTLDVRL